MSRQGLCAALLLATSPAFGQVVVEMRSSTQVPLAVVEVPGGDLQHIAALVPGDASAPATIRGFPVTSQARREGSLWRVTVPGFLATAALEEFLRALAPFGAAAIVTVGPTPPRELLGLGGSVDTIPHRPVPRSPCVRVDGGLQVRRGTPERVELSFLLPPPDDPRVAARPAFVDWVQRRLKASFPGVSVVSESLAGCARLVVRVPADGAEPRLEVRRLRQRLATLASEQPTPEDLRELAAALRPAIAAAASSGAALAGEAAEWLAQGGEVGRFVAVPLLDGAAISELARAVLAGHSGDAVVVEQERRQVPAVPAVLDNGAILALSWRPGETGVAAVAVGNVDPDTGASVVQSLGAAMARRGLPSRRTEVLGVQTVVVTFASADVADVLEELVAPLGQPVESAGRTSWTEAWHALGMSDGVSAGCVSVAVALAPEVEEGGEAARKFLGELRPGGVEVLPGDREAGLAWTPTNSPPEIVAAFEAPAGAAGIVAGGILDARLATGSEGQTRLVALGGRLLLVVHGFGGGSVPALELRMQQVWQAARRPATTGEVEAARLRTLLGLYGDEDQAVARAAASPFLPAVPAAQELLAVGKDDVDRALAALPRWEQARRWARGAGTPPESGPAKPRIPVRESPTRRPGTG